MDDIIVKYPLLCMLDSYIKYIYIMQFLFFCPSIVTRKIQSSLNITYGLMSWVNVFRIIPEFRILRLTFHRKSASKS